jgi:hypothetical protein
LGAHAIPPLAANRHKKTIAQKWAQKKGRRTARQPFIRLFQQDRYLADFFPPLADFFDALAFFAIWTLRLGICPAGMGYLIRKASPEVH